MEIKGNLSDLSLDTLFNLIKLQERVGYLTITRDDQTAILYFENGNLIGATCGKIQGEEVIYIIADWNSGSYQFSDRLMLSVNNINKNGLMIFKEGMRKFFVYSSLNKINVFKKEDDN
jgi:hypothetical protein